MRLREADGVLGKQDAYPFDPRKLKVKPGYNVRDLDSPDERPALDELKASIKERGVEEPLKVQVEGDDVFIIRGHRRHRAAMELIDEGHPVSNVLVFQVPRGMNDADLNLDIIAGNDNRKDLTQLQIAEVIARQSVVYKWDIDRIAKGIGKTNATVANALKVSELPENIKDQIRKGIISATEAVKEVKETRDAKTDPAFAAQLIQDAADEQKRLGKKHKATPKALTAAKERAKPKALAQPKAATQTPLPSGLPATSEQIGAPVTDAHSLEHLQDQIAGLTAGNSETPPAIVAEDEAAASQPLTFTGSRVRNPAEILLSTFLNAEPGELATMYAQLCREHEEAAANDASTATQEQLCVAADVIGQLRFPDEWENAKANSELQQVA